MRCFTLLTTLLCMLLATALAGSRANAAESGLLKWKLKAGETFYLKNVQTLKQTVTANGRDVEQNSVQTSISRFSVKSVSAKGGTVIEQTVLKTTTEGNLPGAGDTSISDKMKGVRFTITLDDHHKVVKFEGYDEFIKKMTGGDKAVAAALRAMMPQETIQKTASETFSQLPGNIVSTGDTWKRAYNLTMGPIGDMAVKATYVYYGKATVEETSVDRIKYVASMKYSPPKAAGGVRLPFTIVGGRLNSDEFSGTLHFNSATGKIVDSTVSMKVSGDLTLQVEDEKRTIGLKQEVTTESYILDENPL
ncbi:MAG: DUF6263 family protein [Pirellulaceae bacterium]|jgi:hypothetical protein|nr:DUF6263 family protein [Pirellulaceae bacterium]MDP7017490.1 DUF6263 family protein [Pirellulaceae bacterium]